MKYDAPWRRVVLRNLPEGMSLRTLYRAMGWNEWQAYQRRKFPHLKLQVAAQMAKVLRPNDPASLLWELAVEEGVPRVGERVILKPNAQAGALARNHQRRCSRCHSAGHVSTSPKCPLGTIASEVTMLHAQASLTPRKPLRRRPSRTRSRATE